MVIIPLRLLCKSLKKQDYYCQKLAIKSMKLLRRSPVEIHPKHLYDDKRSILLEKFSSQYEPGVFLDLGSGSGGDVIAMADKGWKSIGLEYISENITRSKIMSMKSSLLCDFKKHNLEQIPYPISSETVTIVNFINVIEHLYNRQGALSEVKRMLTPDGICIISAPNSDTLWKRLQRFVGMDSRDDIDHKIEYTKKELEKELATSDLELATPLIGTVPSFPFHGFFSLSAAFSPSLYKQFQKLKYFLVRCRVVDTVGWVFAVQKKRKKDR